MATYMYSGFDPLACQVLWARCWPVVAKRGQYGQHPSRCVRPVSRHTTSSKKIGPKSRARALPRPSPAADLAPRRSSFFPGPVFEPCRFSDRFLDRLLVAKWSQNACQKGPKRSSKSGQVFRCVFSCPRPPPKARNCALA